MVFVEMAMGKGAATAGLGLVKLSSVGGSGAAVVPHDVLLDASTLALQTPKLSGIVGSIGTLVPTAKTTAASLVPAMAGGIGFVGTLGCLHSFGAWRLPKWLLDEEEEEEAPQGFNSSIRPSIALLCFADAMTSASIFSSFGAPLDVPLRTFAAGSVLLSFPTTWFTDSIARFWNACAQEDQPARGGIFAEIVASGLAFVWLAWGTHLLSITQTAPQTAPFLFWNSFIQCSATWSCLTFAIAALLVSTVLTLMGTQQK